MSEVSAIIPVRDGERYLGEAIESILGQTTPPREVVVVDDGSTDGSAALAAGYGDPVRVVGQRPLGLPSAVNRGIAETRGHLVAMLDADDVWTADKLDLQMTRLAATPDLEAVFGYAEPFISPDLSDEERAGLAAPPPPGPFRSKATMLVRRTTLERVGPFDPQWRRGDFVDWYARAEEAGIVAEMIPRVVLYRRFHASNMGRSNKEHQVDFTRVARAALHRRRAGG